MSVVMRLDLEKNPSVALKALHACFSSSIQFKFNLFVFISTHFTRNIKNNNV